MEFRALSVIRQAVKVGGDLVSETTRRRAVAAWTAGERLQGLVAALNESVRHDAAANVAADALLAEADAVLEDLLSEEPPESL